MTAKYPVPMPIPTTPGEHLTVIWTLACILDQCPHPVMAKQVIGDALAVACKVPEAERQTCMDKGVLLRQAMDTDQVDPAEITAALQASAQYAARLSVTEPPAKSDKPFKLPAMPPGFLFGGSHDRHKPIC